MDFSFKITNGLKNIGRVLTDPFALRTPYVPCFQTEGINVQGKDAAPALNRPALFSADGNTGGQNDDIDFFNRYIQRRSSSFDYVDLEGLKVDSIMTSRKYAFFEYYFFLKDDNRKNVAALLSMGNICIKMGHFDEAETFISNATRNDTLNTYTEAIRRTVYSLRGARKAESQSVNDGPTELPPGFQYNKYIVFRNTKPDSIMFNLLGELSTDDRYFLFKRYFKLKKNASEFNAQIAFGKACLDLGKFEEAENAFRNASRFNNFLVDIPLGIAQAKMGKKDPVSARKFFTDALTIDSSNQDALKGMEEANKMMGTTGK